MAAYYKMAGGKAIKMTLYVFDELSAHTLVGYSR